MTADNSSTVVLVAEDDPQDQLFTRKAFERCNLPAELRFVHDGEQLIDYLRRRGRFNDSDSAPRPGLILLDLNMPRMDGREALIEIKKAPELRSIPVVVLTSSKAEEVIAWSYASGANSFIVKPSTVAGLANAVRVLGAYWFELVRLPHQ